MQNAVQVQICAVLPIITLQTPPYIPCNHTTLPPNHQRVNIELMKQSFQLRACHSLILLIDIASLILQFSSRLNELFSLRAYFVRVRLVPAT